MTKKDRFIRKPKEKCYLCGNLTLNPYTITCNNCSPYLYKKGQYPHQLLSKDSEWKKMESLKFQKTGNKCEQCGKSNLPLSIYHVEEIDFYDRYKLEWERAIKWTLIRFLSKEPHRLTYADVFLERETKKHYKKQVKYFEMKKEAEERGLWEYPESEKVRTIEALGTFNSLLGTDNLFEKLGYDSPKLRIIGDVYNKDAFYKLVSRLLPLIFEDIMKEYKEGVKTIIKEYSDFGNKTVLCEKCHIINHEEL